MYIVSADGRAGSFFSSHQQKYSFAEEIQSEKKTIHEMTHYSL